MEMLLTLDQAAQRLQLHPETVRRQLVRGALRGIRRGRVWRVPESALAESTPSPTSSWQADAERLAPVYRESLGNGGELTAITTAPGDMDAAGRENNG